MTDYLNSVKQLVERLSLQSPSGIGSSRVSGKKSKTKEKAHGIVSDAVISEHQGEVRYRHRKKTLEKDLPETNKPRKKSKTDISGNTTHRQSVSLYQLIKQNKEKLSGKSSAECHLKLSPTNSPISPQDIKRRTMFEFNVYDANTSDYGESHSSPTLCHKRSPRPSKDLACCSLLSPINPFASEPCSPTKIRNTGQTDFTSSEKFQFLDTELKSPLNLSPVFLDKESTSVPRTNSKTSRSRLSASKSMPLSPPAENAERSARQFGDFQLKLDTLRAELLAMRKGDQELARKLLNLYSEIQILKVKNSCMNYSELLDEAMYEAEIADELPDMCDAPQKFTNKLLTSHGVTSFNIHSRRFSCS
ncbi:uncharacterized protein LOC123540458 [Mercenaria mercenaria]|uniref:uncharacterized protein LOC123540458 n=1 Tax=Mercenaria mercenaria TaxID=6596 RepID=UPI00234EC74E|nr:uncharacterized protein LOC123540458 [Mercenaria mercenaria]XP_045181452.2 uncharacterized protein LOC123540458 [Mercenaria mercenaria]